MSSEASRYTAEINFRHINNSQVLAIGRVPAKSRVLDLGAADGSVAAALQRLGCRIWAVELDPVAAEAAKRFCQDVAVEDLNQLDLAERFGGQRFDVVLMLDILEHLTEPAAVLRRVTSILADGGWGIISLPNIAHLSVRLSLLEGKFTYTDLGLLDRTHLRFFNRAGVDELLQEAGWGMFELVRSTREFGTTEINVEGADPELVHRLESDIEARTYQFVIGAAPLGSKALKHPPVIPGALAQTVSLELEEELRSLHQTVIPELEAQSGSLRSELGSLQAELASRQAQLASREAELVSLQPELGSLQAEVGSLQAELASVRDANHDLQEELDRLRNSKVFRWSRPARKAYHVLLRHRTSNSAVSGHN